MSQLMPHSVKSPRETKDFVVVVLGASAGGLAAIRQFFQGAPMDPQRFALILVMHIDGSGKELAQEVLAQTSRFPVREIVKGEPLQPGFLFLAPPHSYIAIKNGAFDIRPAPSRDNRQAVIDEAFRALARSVAHRAIGIVLSGEGADGSQGLIHISQSNGMTMAQDVDSAEHKAMPQNAIASGLIDHVLEPARMPEILNAYSTYLARVSAREGPELFKEHIAAALIPICEILHRATRHDFKHYKTSTLVRRIQRRMQVLQISSVDAYVDMLKDQPQEAEALFKELLINVTSFFRDAEAFQALREEVIVKALRARSKDHKFRIWVAGCSTGEEAYSLAILMKEVLAGCENAPDIQIIATDIDEHALAVARRGAYSQSAVSGLSQDILAKYFIRKGGRYHIVKDVRELCLFSVHNLINDPPFSQLDLISCRNVLIYLGLHLQKKLIPVFHYALKPGAYLFLGNSESLSTHKELFRTISVKHRIAQRKVTAIKTLSHFSGSVTTYPSHHQEPVKTIETDLNLVGQRIILDEFTPKYAIVNDEGQILSVSSGLTPYFELSEGSFQNNILKVVHPNLRVALRTIFAQAKTEKRIFQHESATLKIDGAMQRVGLVVQPMPQLGEDIALYMVVFRYLGLISEGEPSAKGFDPHPANTAFVEQLETELAATREQLDRTIQDLEASNEELKSSNEELLSMNEELQSANEELEASKEDIQNVNDALQKANTDLENLLASTQIATLFLDENLHIKSFTPAVTQIYNIKDRDLGRSIYDLTHRAEHMPKFPAPQDLKEQGNTEFEIFMPGHAVFLLRITPYVNHEHRRDGLVATFIDITALRRSEGLFRALADSMPQIVFVSDDKGHVSFLNEQWYGYTGDGADKAAYRSSDDFIHPDDRDLVHSAWDKARKTESVFELEFRLRSKVGQYRWFISRAFPIFEEGKIRSWFGTSTDIHESKKAALELERTLKRLSLAQKAGQLGAFEWDLGRKLEWTPELEAIYGLQAGSFEKTYEGFFKRIHPDDRERVQNGIQATIDGQDDFHVEFRIVRPDGSIRWVVGRGELIRDAQGHAVSFVGINVDISRQKEVEMELAERQKEILEAARLYKNVISALTEGVVIADESGQIVEMNEEALKMHGFPTRDDIIAAAEDYKPSFQLKTLDFQSIDFADWPIRRLARGERFNNFEVWVETPFRTWMASYGGSPVIDDSGRIIAGVLTIRDITAQREAENRIRELAESMTQLAWIAQPNGDIVWYNRRWFEYSGTTLDQMLGWGWQSMHDPEYLPEVMERWNSAIATGTAFDMTFPLKARDGQYRWFLTRAFPLKDSNGTIIQWFGTNTDVHDQFELTEKLKASEASLHEKTDQLQLALKAGKLGIFQWDLIKGEASWSEQAYRLFGYEAERSEASYELFLNSIHPEDREQVQKVVDDAIESGTAFEIEFRTHPSRGKVRWLLENGLVSRDAAHGPLYVLGTIHDISARKLAQIEFERRVDVSPAILWITEKDGSCSYLSQQWYAFTGQTPEEALGFGWLAATHPDDKERTGELFRRANARGEPFYTEYRLRTRDGSYRWAIDAGNPRFDAEGQFLGYAGSVFDIHDRIVAEEDVKTSEQRLRSLVMVVTSVPWTSDVAGRFIARQESWELYTGQDFEASQGFGWHAMIHPEDRDRLIAAWARAVREASIFDAVGRVWNAAKQQHRYFQMRAVPLVDAEGAIKEWVGALTDVHEERESHLRAELLASVVNASNDFIGLFTPDMQGVWLNQAGRTMVGLEERAVTESRVLSFFPESEHSKIWDEVLPAVQQKGSWEGELHFQHKVTGALIPVIYNMFPIHDPKTKGIIFYASVTRDITERKAAEESMKNQRQILQTITDNAASCLFMMDSQGHPTFMNPAARRLTGYDSLSEIADRPLHYAVHWKKPDGSHYPMEECPIDNAQVQRKFIYNQEEIFTDKFGRLFPVEYSVSPLEKDGDIVGSVLEFRDVSEQKKVMEELELSRRNYKLLFESTPIPMWIFAADSRRIVDVNEAAMRHYGYTKDEFLSMPVDQLFAEDFSLFLDKTRASTDFDRPLHYSAVFTQLKKDRTPIQVELASSSLILGSESCFIVAAHDVTEKVRIESEQRQWQITLEKAKLAAEAANLAKSSFLANMSHEIRTPLGAILGFTELLKDPVTDDEEKQEYLEVITRNGEQLTAIIDDILDLSKVEAGHLKLQLSEVSPQALMKDIHALLNVKAKTKGIEIEASFDSSVPLIISTDQTRFRQVLINIIGNGIKFTEQGHVRTRVRYETKEQGSYLVLEVSDSGVGIDAVHQSRLFQPFSQADESTTRRFGGTGLGLSLSRRLAEALGGTVELLRSEPGQGSCFGIVIEDKGSKKSGIHSEKQ
ncbi:MAG TPA: PAS domain S-box protein [Oligoflexus sp.]|uniref:PAS domain S-box protein n=1 Tax=Oligoflexus sp. TaxID=1971216 RepID=UPI002D8028EB|nr:PAS domain S-box protein [Oligoflexus sp.]HET9238329.1 PAS domain S-box protein [Oligoflexus sp.]